MNAPLLSLTLGELARLHPAFGDFIADANAESAKPGRTLDSWLSGLSDGELTHIGMDRDQLLAHVEALAADMEMRRAMGPSRLKSLTILGGRDKWGREERLELVLRPGDVICVVGPTGSGKSRLLADIECLAQGDTPSGRRVLINGAPPEPGRRYASERKLVAQLSQNMNFVVDLSVAEFVSMHVACRLRQDGGERSPEGLARDVIACANDLAGERFAEDVSLTQLSGGQSRALMIADVALLSSSPVVLIDEIENAGVDRKRSLELLISKEKIVMVSTHDPILALLGDRRVVVRNGGVADVLVASEAERRHLVALEGVDRMLTDLRSRLRRGERIDVLTPWLQHGLGA